MVTVKLFAALADTAGFRERRIGWVATPRQLLETSPDLLALKKRRDIRVAVNQAWAAWETPLKEGDEVALMPPLLGQ